MKKILIAIFVLILFLLYYVFHIFYSSGFFRDIENAFDGTIEKQIQIFGPEDLQISYDDDFMLISSDDRASRRDGIRKQGNLYYINLKDSSLKPKKLTSNLDIPFFPHGIFMIRTAHEVHKVLAINHVYGKHFIEVFELHKDSLAHVETLQHKSMISPNDVVAVDENRFYFTNDHGYTQGLGKLAEEYLGWSVSNVVYFDGEEYREVAGGIAYANGINLDIERNLIFVASPRDFQIKIYQRGEGGDLTFIENIDCGTGVDNIEFAPDGKIWIGCHPSLLTFIAYASGSTPYSPSEVITIDYRKEGDYQKEIIFLDDGKNVSASTVAGVYQDLIFVGNVMDDHLLVLRRK